MAYLTDACYFCMCDNYLVVSFVKTAFVVLLIDFFLFKVHWVSKQHCWAYLLSMGISQCAISHRPTQEELVGVNKIEPHPELSCSVTESCHRGPHHLAKQKQIRKSISRPSYVITQTAQEPTS